MSEHGHGNERPYDIPHPSVTLRHQIISVYWLITLGICTYLGVNQALAGVEHMSHEIAALFGGH